MAKKCIICEEEATYRIKDGTEFYCNDCAQEHFGDLSFLQKVADEAERLKEVIKARLDGSDTEPEQED